MKKIILLFLLGSLFVFSCKKYSNPSFQVAAIYPTITVNGPLYYSILINGTLPTISAIDSASGKSLNVFDSNVNNTMPGLYTVTLTDTNKDGYISYKSVYIGVTSASPSLNLSGWYVRNASPVNAAYFTKLGTGLFMTSNVGGDDTVTQASSIVSAVFVVTSDTTVDFGSQLTSAGTLMAANEVLSLAPGDTTLSYAVSLTGFGTEVRTFVKQ